MPEVENWDAEKDRLQLACAAAVRQLMTHTGCEDFYLPFDGDLLRIVRLKNSVAMAIIEARREQE